MSRFIRPTVCIAALSHLIALSVLGTASAQSAPTGAPPPDAKPLVEAPKKPIEPPKIEDKTDGTTATLSAGGQAATGNARLLTATVNGAYDTRFDNNGIGFYVVGNYSRTAMPGEEVQTTAQNLQGRLRYDRYFVEQASAFLITTGRHDRGTGIQFRLNVDPGVKYLFMVEQANSLWAEAGYDFQYDIRREDSLGPPGMQLDKTATDHSSRLYAGGRHAFNEQVTLSSGVEYLQSFIDSSRARVNFDVLFAAKVGAGLAVGAGFVMRYDNAPLPGKENLDTATNLTIIYSYSDVKKEEPAAPPPYAPPPAPAPPPPPPADTAAPASGGATLNSGNPATPLNPAPTPPPATEPTKPTPP
jgi:hypothetical protein